MLISDKNLCTNCFEDKSENTDKCSICGYSESDQMEVTSNLSVGTVLMGKFVIGKVLGKGGFGITYLAYDLRRECKVAIKEYMPDTLSYRTPGNTLVSTYLGEKEENFKLGSEKFYEEAKTVSKFNGHPNIINVYEFFYENNTAYFVMEYIDGVDLKKYLFQKGGKITQEECIILLSPIMDALIVVHSVGILHRDISPDNIYVTKDGNVKLLDFGAARQVLGEKSKSLSVILKPGFAPIEQYQTHGRQGQWTDVYALAATMYFCLTGQVPEAAMDRIEDDNLKHISEFNITVTDWFNQILRKALSLKAIDRHQTMVEFKQAIIREEAIISNNVLLNNVASTNNVSSNNVVSINDSEPKIQLKVNSNHKINWSNAIIPLIAAFAFMIVIGLGVICSLLKDYQSNTVAVEDSKGEVLADASNDTVKSEPDSESQSIEVSNKEFKYVVVKGTIVISPICSYTGEWKDNKPNGYGVITISEDLLPDWQEGEKISGTFSNGLLNGKGTDKRVSGYLYEGNYENSLKNGYGVETYSDGGKYEGNFKDDKRNGQGKCYWASGESYDGEWKDDNRNGYGVDNYANGNRYEGNFKDDKRNGQGKYYWAGGGSYDGEWKDDNRNGYGVDNYANGDKYEGNFKDDIRNGQGKYYWADGESCDGEWKDDKRNGYGVFYFSDGSQVQGEFKDDALDGVAIYTDKNGDKREETFVNGRLQD